MLIKNHLEIDENLTIAGKDTVRLAKKYGTPLYVTNANRIKKNYRVLEDSLRDKYEDIRIHYACKANTNLSVLEILNEEGAWLDAVSVGEVESGIRAGFDPKKILYTGTSVSFEEMKEVMEKNVTINVDSLSGLNKLVKLGGKKFSVRINPEVGAGHHDHCITGGLESKFGIWEDKAITAYEKGIKKGLTPVGIHMHIGSGILDFKKYEEPVNKLLDIAGKISQKLEVEFEFIDIGGGLGIPYKPKEDCLNLKKFSEIIVSKFTEKLEKLKLGRPALALEPGRYLVGDSTILLTQVQSLKETPKYTFAGVDAGFNTLLRPVMYGSYHHIFNASNPRGETKTYSIAGPLCESGDLLAKEREIPKISEGDILAVRDTGAYGFSTASRYNSRPLPAEIMIDDETFIIRERESLEHLFRDQK